MADVAGSARTVEELKAVLGEMAAACACLEPEDLLARHAGTVIELTAAIGRFVDGAQTLAVYRVLESGIWKDEGFRSPQHWLASKRGCTVAEAGRMVRTSERVQAQPKTKDALRNGDLSGDEADAVSEATDAEPEKEEEHLGNATGRAAGGGSGPGGDGRDRGAGPGPAGPAGAPPKRGRPRASLDELRRQRDRAKARADADARAKEERLHSERTASKGATSEGGWQLWAKHTKDAGLKVEAALDAAMDELKAERRAAGLEPLTYGRLLADALVRVAEKSMGAKGPAAGPPARRPKGSAMRAMLTADLAALRDGCLQGEQTCEIAGFGTVSLSVARDLLGDALLAVVLRDGKDVVNVTHLGDFTDVQRDAIWARAGGVCEVPGCGVTSGLEIDHDHERQHGGASNIANGSLKCWADHQLKTHGTKRLIGPPGRRAWVDVGELAWDPAREGPLPAECIEHLLPPDLAGPTRPTRSRATRAGPAPPPDAGHEQLDLLV